MQSKEKGDSSMENWIRHHGFTLPLSHQHGGLNMSSHNKLQEMKLHVVKYINLYGHHV
jgi:hypothetical protein